MKIVYDTKRKIFGNIELSNKDLERLSVVKSKEKYLCCKCHKSMNRGSYVIGRGETYKFCFDCFEDIVKTIRKSLSDVDKKLDSMVKDLDKDINKYMKNNLVRSI